MILKSVNSKPIEPVLLSDPDCLYGGDEQLPSITDNDTGRTGHNASKASIVGVVAQLAD